MHGVVADFDHSQGCGVIKCDVPKIDVSVCTIHIKDRTHLQPGDVVTFTGIGGPKGPEAREVILLWRGGIPNVPPIPQVQKNR